MNGGRHRGPIDVDGCLTELGYGFLWIIGLIVTVAALMWIFSKPADVCVKWDTIKVIEKTEQQNEILKDKQVCSQYVPSPKPSPFWQAWEWAKS